MKTIPRNHTKKIAAIEASITRVVYYDQNDGGLKPTILDAAMSDLYRFEFSKLYDHGTGQYTVHVHSNLWYHLYTQDFLDQADADKRAREEQAATRGARMAAMRSDSGQQREARTAAAPIATVTVTRTRMAIGDQISQACTALGIKLGHGWNKGTATFLVNGRDYTAGELADLVLIGGFAANYGGNTVNVNWDSPLVAPKNSEQRMGRAVMTIRGAQDRVSASVARDLDDVAQTLLDALHERAIEDAPRPRVDFPSGAPEPGREVSGVRCVRTGVLFVRDGVAWRNTKDGTTCNWYRMNETDPMSEGFMIDTYQP